MKINRRVLFACIVIVLAIYGLFFTDYFMIKDIVIEGNHLVPSEKITEAIPMGKSIFLASTKSIKSQILSNNHELQDIQISKGIPNTVKVVVLERENKLVWKTGEDRFYVSSSGMITRKLESSEAATVPLVSDAKNFSVSPGDIVASPHFITFVQNIYDNFFNTTNIKPTNFEVPETTFDLILHTEAGFYVKLDTTRSAAKQLDDLKKVLVAQRDNIHEYVDLRIDGWAYYK